MTHATITKNAISGDGVGGIYLYPGSDNAVITHNTLDGDAGDAIGVTGNNAKVTANNVQGNTGWGVNVAGDAAHITKNTVNANTRGGILVAGDAPLISDNHATGNGWNYATPGLGIDASGSAAPGGTGNVVRDSADPQQCDPTLVC